MRTRTTKKYKVTSPVRFFFFIFILVLLLTFAVYTAVGKPIAAASEPYVYKEITVRENDTLWHIASEYGPKDVDIRIIINEICEVNGISAGEISCGDSILVPVEMN